MEKGRAFLRVAASNGPEQGTVGSEYVLEAVKEALKGAGFDMLLLYGFAFDAIRLRNRPAIAFCKPVMKFIVPALVVELVANQF